MSGSREYLVDCRCQARVVYARCTHRTPIVTLPARSDRIRRTARAVAPTRKSERLAVRITKRQHALLTEASRAAQTTVSEFVLDAATEAAEQVLADRTQFQLPAEQWRRFLSALDAPVEPLPRLRQLLESRTVLDEA